MRENLRPFLVTLSLLFALSVEAQSPREIAKSAFQSSVFIEVADRNGIPMAFGSGFVVSPSLIVTNLHVIQGASSAKVNLVGSKTTFATSSVLAVDAVNDLALLSVAGLLAPSLLISDETPEVGDRVYVIGNPKGFQGTISDGLVSAFRNLENRKLIQISAPISPGSSGGPVLNEVGKVLGVTVLTFKDGQNLNFAIPSGALLALMKSKSSSVDMGSLKDPQQNKNRLSQAVEGIQLAHFTWAKNEGFDGDAWHLHYVLRNLTNTPVNHIRIVILLLDGRGAPVSSWENEAGMWSDKYGKPVSPHSAMTYAAGFSKFDKSLTKSIQYRVLSYLVE